MKNTNIFLEVDDITYNLVVAPHKKNKTFTKLINALLRSYMEDQYVRASVEGSLDDLKKQSAESLDSALSGLNQSLANMGLFTDELDMTAKKGTTFFSKKTQEHTEDKEKAESILKEGKEKIDKENAELRQEMDSLRKGMEEVSKQNADIMDMLKKFMVSAPVREVEPVEEVAVTVETPVRENTVPVKPVVEEPVVPESKKEDVPQDDAMKKMTAFMMGNFKSF